MQGKNQLINYRNTVLNKYQIYNGLFLNLPFDAVYSTGMLLPLLSKSCDDGFEKQQSPYEIISSFLDKHLNSSSQEEQLSTLFQFIQYIERQIVLFDSVEEAAYVQNHDLNGPGSIPYLANKADYSEKKQALKKTLEDYSVRVVLTAHPTQFYPGAVLGIMNDLSDSIKNNDTTFIEQLLKQLGKTPLFNKQKPTPFDEAVSLVWYLENVFYSTIKSIKQRINHFVFDGNGLPNHEVLQLGFWPGGDRDGNPFVSAQITEQVAQRLRESILKCYHNDVRRLKRRLTFVGVDALLDKIEKNLYEAAYLSKHTTAFTADTLLDELNVLRSMIETQHQGLFIERVDDLISQVQSFGFYFATLDVRQDSRVHHQVMQEIAQFSDELVNDYEGLSDREQINALLQINSKISTTQLKTELAKDTINSIKAIENIQHRNGEKGANRYIISNCQSQLNVLEVLAFFKLAGWSKSRVSVDIVPLFETIEDLANAATIMDALYNNAAYKKHLSQRQNQQTIMLGFSDGTKDGGYLAANWSIVKAKEQLSTIAKQHGVDVVFFDGRGGPPARGGGEAHKFYASQSPAIQNKATQLTIQGQTISANFGHLDSAQYNLEQLLSAGLSGAIGEKNKGWDTASRQLFESMATDSLKSYERFKKHDKFIPYLEKISTLKYYGKTNIGSRPTKRSQAEGLVFADLRAIPFVGAWSQLKQNVLGYYGLGEALENLIDAGRLAALQELYQQSGYFKAIIDNSMMSICKSFMPLTAYLQHDKEFGDFWLNIYAEYNNAVKCLKAVSQTKELLAEKPLRKQSIQAREAIVLPLLAIQQYCLQQINTLKVAAVKDDDLIATYEKLVTRSLYGNINASRNSV